jgi:hypothetical protein
MFNSKFYVLCALEDGNPIYNLMFNSLFTLKTYIEKYDRKVYGEEWEFNAAGKAELTGTAFYLLNDEPDFTLIHIKLD